MLQEEGQSIQPSQYQRLTADQEEARKLLARPQKHTCLVGGARSGKTSLFVRAIVTRALRGPGSRHLMVRHRANALKSSVWLDTLPKVMRMWFPGVPFRERYSTFFELGDKAEIWGGGLDDEERVDKILGQEYVTIYAGECSQIPYSSILTLRTRLAQNVPGVKLRGYYDLNPTVTSHWSNMEFGFHKDPITGLALPDPENFKRMFMNPEGNAENLPPGYIDSLKNMPKKFRERFYEGKYVADVEGALWPTDVLESRRIERIDPDPDGKRLREFIRIAIGVDPSGAQSKSDIKSDEIGIVVVGLRANLTAVVLEDATMRGSPKEW
ncbi:MAG TPA: phage terminase large subunit, partial [Nitrospira sp.]|nr:phage terminase large subunit [Nitrospira sp.]